MRRGRFLVSVCFALDYMLCVLRVVLTRSCLVRSGNRAETYWQRDAKEGLGLGQGRSTWLLGVSSKGMTEQVYATMVGALSGTEMGNLCCFVVVVGYMKHASMLRASRC
ncbi:hypothetical protein J3F83DRAFT_744631 [Trichoderma novae-zelandiae]